MVATHFLAVVRVRRLHGHARDRDSFPNALNPDCRCRSPRLRGYFFSALSLIPVRALARNFLGGSALAPSFPFAWRFCSAPAVDITRQGLSLILRQVLTKRAPRN